MLTIKWQGSDSPDEKISNDYRESLISFIKDKVKDLLDEIQLEKGYFDISDADNPSQLSIVPKNFSTELTRKILRKFSE